MRPLPPIAALLTAAAACCAQPAPGFWLVGLPQGAAQGTVTGLSQDGGTAVGWNYNPQFPGSFTAGFRWTRQGGRDDFGLLPGMPYYTPASAVSSNGGTIAGTSAGGTSG